MRLYVAIHAASSASRRGPSRQVRTRPCFSVVTSRASSRMLTCFLMPVSVMAKSPASSLIDASPRPSRIEDAPARRIGERGERRVEVRLILNHLVQ